VSWEVFFIGIGISFAYWLDFGMSYAGGSIAWRLPIAVQLIFAICVIVLLFGLPESPRWLFKRGREREAIEVLCQVYDLPVEDPYIQSEIKGIKSAIASEIGVKSHLSLFKNDKLRTRRRVMLAYFGLFMNQMYVSPFSIPPHPFNS
jgi:MFS family permease